MSGTTSFVDALVLNPRASKHAGPSSAPTSAFIVDIQSKLERRLAQILTYVIDSPFLPDPGTVTIKYFSSSVLAQHFPQRFASGGPTDTPGAARVFNITDKSRNSASQTGVGFQSLHFLQCKLQHHQETFDNEV